DKMNDACANKLLKLLEEPPNKTVFILVAEEEEAILQTIRSRCQMLRFSPLSESVIAEALEEKFGCEKNEALKIAVQANGNFNKALNLFRRNEGDEQFEKWFIDWVRSAFKAKGNKAVINNLLQWSEAIASTGRETQKSFLLFCQEFFRQALLKNYNANTLVFFEPKTEGFKLENFAPFIHGDNIMSINKELEDAIYHIERNGNSKIILTDLSIKLTRLLHQKSA
ncbi:MAG TPA: DNA polymerase III subunit delta', partial [Salinimicrobium sp.]|nr:DNA polymerase III subunit delta' [Salinimicrobium sp.]